MNTGDGELVDRSTNDSISSLPGASDGTIPSFVISDDHHDDILGTPPLAKRPPTDSSSSNSSSSKRSLVNGKHHGISPTLLLSSPHGRDDALGTTATFHLLSSTARSTASEAEPLTHRNFHLADEVGDAQGVCEEKGRGGTTVTRSWAIDSPPESPEARPTRPTTAADTTTVTPIASPMKRSRRGERDTTSTRTSKHHHGHHLHHLQDTAGDAGESPSRSMNSMQRELNAQSVRRQRDLECKVLDLEYREHMLLEYQEDQRREVEDLTMVLELQTADLNEALIENAEKDEREKRSEIWYERTTQLHSLRARRDKIVAKDLRLQLHLAQQKEAAAASKISESGRERSVSFSLYGEGDPLEKRLDGTVLVSPRFDHYHHHHVVSDETPGSRNRRHEAENDSQQAELTALRRQLASMQGTLAELVHQSPRHRCQSKERTQEEAEEEQLRVAVASTATPTITVCKTPPVTSHINNSGGGTSRIVMIALLFLSLFLTVANTLGPIAARLPIIRTAVRLVRWIVAAKVVPSYHAARTQLLAPYCFSVET